MDVLLFVLTVLFGLGSIGDKDQRNRNNYTWICIACILAIAMIKIF